MDIGLVVIHDAATKEFAVRAKEAWNKFVVSVNGVNAGYEVKPFSVNREGMGNSFTAQEVANQLQIPFSAGLAIVRINQGSQVDNVIASAPANEVSDPYSWFRSVLIEGGNLNAPQGLQSAVFEQEEPDDRGDAPKEKKSLGKQVAEAIPGIFCLFYPEECRGRQEKQASGLWIALAAVGVVLVLTLIFKK